MAAAINLPPTADHAPSIADLTLRCQGALDDCRQIAELQHDEWVDLRFTDFNSWVESSGALAIGRASLDSRLDGTEDMKDMVTDSLEILEIALLGCIKTGSDVNTPYNGTVTDLCPQPVTPLIRPIMPTTTHQMFPDQVQF